MVHTALLLPSPVAGEITLQHTHSHTPIYMHTYTFSPLFVKDNIHPSGSKRNLCPTLSNVTFSCFIPPMWMISYRRQKSVSHHSFRRTCVTVWPLAFGMRYFHSSCFTSHLWHMEAFYLRVLSQEHRHRGTESEYLLSAALSLGFNSLSGQTRFLSPTSSLSKGCRRESPSD